MRKFIIALLLAAATVTSVYAKNFRVITELSGGISIEYTQVAIGADVSAGYQTKGLFIGGGVGFDCLELGESAGCLPIYAHVRYDFFNANIGKLTPFVSTKLGYQIAIDGMESGFYASPTVGLRLPVSETMGLNFGITYKFCKIYYYYYYPEESTNAVMLSVGLDF